MLGKLEIKHHQARHGYVLLSGQTFLKRLHTKNMQVPQARPGIRLTAPHYHASGFDSTLWRTGDDLMTRQKHRGSNLSGL